MARKGKAISEELSGQRILLVDPHKAYASLLKRALHDSGYEVLEVLHDVGRLIERADYHRPDLIVMGIDIPDIVSIDSLVSLKRVHPLPVVMFAEKETPQIIEQIVRAGVSAFIVDDVQPQRFKPIINIAVARFREQQGLLNELEKTRNKLAERKVLEKAKGMLMKQKGLSEEEAYSSLRKMAMDKGLPIAKVAESIIDVLRMLDNQGCT